MAKQKKAKKKSKKTTITTLEIAQTLQAKGYKITLLSRKEGGHRISSINGKHYTGSKGNIEARKILGASLTEAQTRHLERIKQKKGVFGKASTKGEIPEDFIKLQNRINRAFKNIGNSGRVTRSKIRYRLREDGHEETRAYLHRALLYAKGYVFDEDLQAYYQRMELNFAKINTPELNEVLIRLREIIDLGFLLKDVDFKELLDLTYTWEQSRGTPQAMSDLTFSRKAIEILDRAEY